ncbi:MAG TPA: helix-turn-helix transcriptional regulator [Dehalococcoidia bacterium]|nr:helix-turn-helix transcriptional regulator [Dehalococcoidia bacterium]
MGPRDQRPGADLQGWSLRPANGRSGDGVATRLQIADELVISLNTVQRHVSNIFGKTGAANRADAVSYAHDHGLA